MMESLTLKMVVSGPVGAGKTTFTRTLSSTPVVTTDEAASEAILSRRRRTRELSLRPANCGLAEAQGI